MTNAGPSHAGSFSITDQVPAAITGVTATCAVTGTGGCGTNASSGNAVSFTNASLAPGAGNVLTITISGTVSSGASGALANTATVAAAGATDTNPANDSATDTSSPGTSQANLGITKTGPASILPGGSLTYTLTVSNAGPSDALDVTVSDPTPSGLAFVSNAGDCTTPFPCTLAAVPVGATRTITATFIVPPGYTAPAPIVNTATVSSAATDPDTTNNSATLSTALVRDADVEVTKSAPANVLAGQTIDVTVSVLNHGPNGATGVEVRDVLPPGLQFVAEEPTQGVYDPGSGIWTVGALAVSASAQLVITATATEPGSITNLAVKTGQSEPDPNPANDSSGSTTNVAAAADLAIDTSVDRGEALVGETVTFTVRATNRGPSAATGVTITETTDAGPDDHLRDAVARHLRRGPLDRRRARRGRRGDADPRHAARRGWRPGHQRQGDGAGRDRPEPAQQQRRGAGQRRGRGRPAGDEGGEQPGAGRRGADRLHRRRDQPWSERGHERGDSGRAARQRVVRLGVRIAGRATTPERASGRWARFP